MSIGWAEIMIDDMRVDDVMRMHAVGGVFSGYEGWGKASGGGLLYPASEVRYLVSREIWEPKS